MRRTLTALLLALLSYAAPALAQDIPSPTPPTVRIAWDYVESTAWPISAFRVYNGNTKVGDDIAAAAREIPFPALQPGNYTLTLRAVSNGAESIDSNVLAVRVLVLPSPTNLRLITAVYTPEAGWVPVLEVV